MRFVETPLLQKDDNGRITASDRYVVHIPICDRADDPEFAEAVLFEKGLPEVRIAAEGMVRLTDPNGRLAYVLADEQKRYRPVAALEGTINAAVNDVMRRGEGPQAD